MLIYVVVFYKAFFNCFEITDDALKISNKDFMFDDMMYFNINMKQLQIILLNLQSLQSLQNLQNKYNKYMKGIEMFKKIGNISQKQNQVCQISFFLMIS